MTYIAPEDRDDLMPNPARRASTPGELGFQIAVLVDRYFAVELDYAAINDVLGALEIVKAEISRRYAAPYADQMAALNGDVFTTHVKPFGRKK